MTTTDPIQTPSASDPTPTTNALLTSPSKLPASPSTAPTSTTSSTASSSPPPLTTTTESINTNNDADESNDEEDAMLSQLEGEEDDETSEEKPTLLGDEHTEKSKDDQLVQLLNRASEYSNFIAQDLKELEANLTKEAEDEQEANENNKPTKKKAKGQSAESTKRMADAVKATTSKAIFVQPKNLSTDCTLKDYQLEGVRWLTSLYENGVSGILADEMGLGKTIQVIALIAHLQTKGVSGPFIVVAPLATLPNWVREFEKWLPQLPVCRYHGTQDERNRFLEGPDAPLNKSRRKNVDFPVIITSYEMAIRDVKKLNKLGEFAYMIVDEGQRLKNRKCCLIKNLKLITASNRLLLSGTPIQNNLDELWSLLNFVNPNIFDDLNVFQSWFGFKNIGADTKEGDILEAQKQQNIVSKLHEILRPFLLRRIKTDVLKEMPPKKEIVVYAGMSKLQQGYTLQIENGTLREDLMKQGIENATRISQINQLMNHRKNSNHPFLFGEPIDPTSGTHVGTAFPQLLIRASGKFNLLDRMLTRLHKDKHQVLIFSQMTEVLSIIEDYLVYRSWNYCRIDGSTKIDDRQKQMDEFNSEKTNGADGTRNDNDDRKFVFLLSTRAGGLGINLASADTCIIFDSDWNPHQDSQAMDRCHRIGQTRPVAVYRLLTANSVDMEMMEKQISKKKLDRMTIAGGDFRKGGIRSKGELNNVTLADLLADDIKDLKSRGQGDSVEHVRISEDELERILDREKLFPKDESTIITEGKMYDILDNRAVSGVLGAMA